jgi:hypothetical protein
MSFWIFAVKPMLSATIAQGLVTILLETITDEYAPQAKMSYDRKMSTHHS